jgi:hypothetical protein
MKLSPRDTSSASSNAGSSKTSTKILKVLRNPRLAPALLNAQFRIRRKARLPLGAPAFAKVHAVAVLTLAEFGNCKAGAHLPADVQEVGRCFGQFFERHQR